MLCFTSIFTGYGRDVDVAVRISYAFTVVENKIFHQLYTSFWLLGYGLGGEMGGERAEIVTN